MIVDTSQDPMHLVFVSKLTGTQDFGPCKTIAFLSENSKAVVVYNWKDESNIGMSIAATSPKWCNRKAIKIAFGFPFIQLGMNRVTSIIRETNEKSIKLVKGLGFRFEGEMRGYYENGDSALMFGLLKNECKWI